VSPRGDFNPEFSDYVWQQPVGFFHCAGSGQRFPHRLPKHKMHCECGTVDCRNANNRDSYSGGAEVESRSRRRLS
jgi:hypothetical protein